MSNKRPFYIQINGTKIIKNENRTKTACLESVVTDDQKFPDWHAAYAFADKQARDLKIENGWDEFNLTVVEWVPVKKVVYSLHLNEVKRILGPVFSHHWQSIMSNPVMLSVADRLADNDYELLHKIVHSFIQKLCPEFVTYQRDVRPSDMKDFETAYREFVKDYYHFQFREQASEAADQSL